MHGTIIIITEHMTKTSPKKCNNKDKIQVVDAILDMYPNLKRDRKAIIRHVIGKGDPPKVPVLEKIMHDGKPFYRDPYGKIFNSNVKLVGCFVCCDGNYKYYFFD